MHTYIRFRHTHKRYIMYVHIYSHKYRHTCKSEGTAGCNTGAHSPTLKTILSPSANMQSHTRSVVSMGNVLLNIAMNHSNPKNSTPNPASSHRFISFGYRFDSTAYMHTSAQLLHSHRRCLSHLETRQALLGAKLDNLHLGYTENMYMTWELHMLMHRAWRALWRGQTAQQQYRKLETFGA